MSQGAIATKYKIYIAMPKLYNDYSSYMAVMGYTFELIKLILYVIRKCFNFVLTHTK